MHRFLIVALFICFACAGQKAMAEDAVLIRGDSGYPPVGESSEYWDISVKRLPPGLMERKLDIDKFFDDIHKIMAEAHVPAKWSGGVVMHAPAIRLRVTLDDVKFDMYAPYDTDGFIPPTPASEDDIKVLAASKSRRLRRT